MHIIVFYSKDIEVEEKISLEGLLRAAMTARIDVRYCMEVHGRRRSLFTEQLQSCLRKFEQCSKFRRQMAVYQDFLSGPIQSRAVKASTVLSATCPAVPKSRSKE